MESKNEIVGQTEMATQMSEKYQISRNNDKWFRIVYEKNNLILFKYWKDCLEFETSFSPKTVRKFPKNNSPHKQSTKWINKNLTTLCVILHLIPPSQAI